MDAELLALQVKLRLDALQRAVLAAADALVADALQADPALRAAVVALRQRSADAAVAAARAAFVPELPGLQVQKSLGPRVSPLLVQTEA